MECPRCHGGVPDVAHYCHHCGNDLLGQDSNRKKSYAAQPNQPVATFAPVGTIMPRGVIGHPGTYQVALVIGLLIMVVAAALGAIPLALAVAAFAIPIVYIVYVYDVNLWEDQPVPVTLLAFVLSFALAVGWTNAWQLVKGNPDVLAAPASQPGLDLRSLLIAVLLVPLVGEAVRQVGPLVLASRREFDDLMDGFTFGVISGVAYSAAETLVLYWSLLRIGFAGGNIDALQMIILLLLHGFVKPLIYGTATGIAGAEYSGLGKGFDGFSIRWLRAAGLAVGAVALFNLGAQLSMLVTNSGAAVVLVLVWAVLPLGVLTLAARNVLHVGLLEAALEAIARAEGTGGHDELAFCANCEMPLLPGSRFCAYCGQSVQAHRHIPVTVGATPKTGTSAETPVGIEEGQE